MTDMLLKNGIMGAVFLIVTIPLAIYARQQSKSLKDVQDQRAVDAQQVVDKLLTMNDKWNHAVSEQLKVVEQVEGTLRDIKSALQDVRDLLIERKQ